MMNPTSDNKAHSPSELKAQTYRFIGEIIGYRIRIGYLPAPPAAAILNPKTAEYFLKKDLAENPKAYFGRAALLDRSVELAKPSKEQLALFKDALADVEQVIKSPSKTYGRVSRVLTQVPLHKPYTLEDGTEVTTVALPLNRLRALNLVKESAQQRRRTYELIIATIESELAKDATLSPSNPEAAPDGKSK
jgi:hypothetical protein